MDARSLELQVFSLLEPVVKDEGFLLYDVRWTEELGRKILRVMIERESGGGVTLGDCALVSHSVEDLLEVKDVVKSRYDLEVSSPGMDRPLRFPKHFHAVVGKMVRVKTVAPIAGRQNYKGLLQKVKEDGFVMEIDGKDYTIPFSMVNRAHVEPDQFFNRQGRAS